MKEEKLNKNKIEEIVSYKLRQHAMIFFFLFLLLLPFVYSIIAFTDLKDCQSKPSNGYPSLQVPTPKSPPQN